MAAHAALLVILLTLNVYIFLKFIDVISNKEIKSYFKKGQKFKFRKKVLTLSSIISADLKAKIDIEVSNQTLFKFLSFKKIL